MKRPPLQVPIAVCVGSRPMGRRVRAAASTDRPRAKVDTTVTFCVGCSSMPPPRPTRELPTACVIGAGSSGIAAAKKLNDAGIPFDCFEKSDRVGGNWVFGNRNGMSSTYRRLHINTSRDRMECAEFPMPRDYPDFPHHTQIARYFDDYVDHFGFRDSIVFETGVDRAERDSDGTWQVTLDNGEAR